VNGPFLPLWTNVDINHAPADEAVHVLESNCTNVEAAVTDSVNSEVAILAILAILARSYADEKMDNADVCISCSAQCCGPTLLGTGSE
jgi:hypothetical protein